MISWINLVIIAYGARTDRQDAIDGHSDEPVRPSDQPVRKDSLSLALIIFEDVAYLGSPFFL